MTPYSLLLTVVAVLFASRTGAALAVRLRQPAVIGEILGVLLLGPNTLGSASPAIFHVLFPNSAISTVALLAQLGLAVFVMVIGLELRQAKVSLSTSVVSTTLITSLMALGVTLLLTFWSAGLGLVAPSGLQFVFLFCVFSITAVPVLSLILKDRGISSAFLAQTALGVAVVSDILVWTLFGLLTILSREQAIMQKLLGLATFSALFIVIYGVSKQTSLVNDFFSKRANITGGLLIAAALTTYMSETAGLSILGPLLLGYIIGAIPQVNMALHESLEDVSRQFLLPFLYLNAAFSLGELDRISLKLVMFLILAATISKVVGGMLGGCVAQLPRAQSFQLGVLLNTRGLTELVLLKAGLERGFIHQELYTALVVMALVTTLATGPLLDLAGTLQHKQLFRKMELLLKRGGVDSVSSRRG